MRGKASTESDRLNAGWGSGEMCLEQIGVSWTYSGRFLINTPAMQWI